MFPGREAVSCPSDICQENNQYLNRLEDDLGQPIFGSVSSPAKKPSAGPGRGDRCDQHVVRASLSSRWPRASCRVAVAQFGHPLKGQWSGEWGPKDNPKRLLLDLHWDGKRLRAHQSRAPSGAR